MEPVMLVSDLWEFNFFSLKHLFGVRRAVCPGWVAPWVRTCPRFDLWSGTCRKQPVNECIRGTTNQSLSFLSLLSPPLLLPVPPSFPLSLSNQEIKKNLIKKTKRKKLEHWQPHRLARLNTSLRGSVLFQTFSIPMMIEMTKGRRGRWKSTRALSCTSCHRSGWEWILLR